MIVKNVDYRRELRRIDTTIVAKHGKQDLSPGQRLLVEAAEARMADEEDLENSG